jgi:hypothetical protein
MKKLWIISSGPPLFHIMLGLYISLEKEKLGNMDAFVDMKRKLKVPFSMELIILATWGIWIVRNNKIFSNVTPSFNTWKAVYYHELRMVSYRMKMKYDGPFKEWL